MALLDSCSIDAMSRTEHVIATLDPAAGPLPADATTTQSTRSAEVKVVLVVREGLPSNLAANAAAVLGASIGAVRDLPLGPDAVDASGTVYEGIVTTPVPVLVTGAEELRVLFRQAAAQEGTTVLALTEVARQARTYDAYLSDLAQAREADADIVALVVAGRRNQVTKITKRLPLLGA
ncbi:hypothetical protein GCM10025864_13270 [Luteimicrobium album]|uniref:DUF2000 domain-containing protein n=2 Tax=Luteimicrobium album TaxID=1054550 RepID=A0ABQ6I068_9MICO|nr:hypothetical protein GCM10025864_13270 [Luteimicrobium album]